MKKLTQLLLLFIVGFLNSCSNDIDDSVTNSTLIDKTITYAPEQTNYNTKTIGYYDNQNRKVLDSVFDNNQIFLRKITTIRTTQSTTSNTYNATNVLTQSHIDNYDLNGRLITSTTLDGAGVITFKDRFEYDDINKTITKYNLVGTVLSNSAVTLFKINDTGSIYFEENLSNNNLVKYLEFEGDKPIKMVQPDFDPIVNTDYTYFPNVKPMNLRISNTERNNVALRFGIEHIVYNWDYYYSTVADLYQVLMTFDGNNYPLTAKYSFVPSPSLSETLYYY